ncbi:Hypothetical predicted protein [Octopus vulgaris]|uniref:Uncharacterized protein n=1 Tax=Octopus vulgaris TaxID=6645 RepID=A0AA36BVS0_OCTVU|nr:Hypothetical predicted protein [Octopus vulgaris]
MRRKIRNDDDEEQEEQEDGDDGGGGVVYVGRMGVIVVLVGVMVAISFNCHYCDAVRLYILLLPFSRSCYVYITRHYVEHTALAIQLKTLAEYLQEETFSLHLRNTYHIPITNTYTPTRNHNMN